MNIRALVLTSGLLLIPFGVQAATAEKPQNVSRSYATTAISGHEGLNNHFLATRPRLPAQATVLVAEAHSASESRNTVIDGRQSHEAQLRHQNVILNEFHALNLSPAQWAQIQAYEKAFHETRRQGTPSHDQIMLHNKRMMMVLTPAQRTQFSTDMAKRWEHNAAAKQPKRPTDAHASF